jgi:hypothetical protein
MEMMIEDFKDNKAIQKSFMQTIISKIAGTAAQSVATQVVPT